jgi:hypothetical protein
MLLSLTFDVGACADSKEILGSLGCSYCGLLIGLVGLNVEVESEGLFVLAVHAHFYD